MNLLALNSTFAQISEKCSESRRAAECDSSDVWKQCIQYNLDINLDPSATLPDPTVQTER